ncbi:MAG TPA: hypothetical protein VFS20_06105 [Longimicrobium sp.]|nr:hypothetical protein [Longimicrobium sp.]
MEHGDGVAPPGATRAEQVLLAIAFTIMVACLAGAGLHALGRLPAELAGLARPLLSSAGTAAFAALGLYWIRRLAGPSPSFRWTREAATVFVVAGVAYKFAISLRLVAPESPAVFAVFALLLVMGGISLFVDGFAGAAAGALTRAEAMAGISGGLGLLLFAGAGLADSGLLALAALPPLCIAGAFYLGARLAARRAFPR